MEPLKRIPDFIRPCLESKFKELKEKFPEVLNGISLLDCIRISNSPLHGKDEVLPRISYDFLNSFPNNEDLIREVERIIVSCAKENSMLVVTGR